MSLNRTVSFVGLAAFLFSCSGESEISTAKIEESEVESSVSESDAKSSIGKDGDSSASKKSSSSSKISSSSDDDALVVESLEDLPNCTAKREGLVAFVKAEKKIYACDDGRWSVEGKTSSSSKKNSSSSSEEVKRSSSSLKTDVSSSSEKKSSSSSEKRSSSSEKLSSSVMEPDSEYGSCVPVNNPINRGEKTAWKMSRNASVGAQVILNADFEWFFNDGSPATSQKHGNMSSDEIRYTTSGTKNAKLTFTPQGGTPVTIDCAPLQVNGTAITGCKCSASETGEVDVGSTVEWTVSGCRSNGANIVGYEWGGGVVGDGVSATATLTEKNEVIGPTVVVSNDDNTLLSLECPAVTAVDTSRAHRCLGGLSMKCLRGEWKLNGVTRITETDGDTLYSIDPNHDFSESPATLQFKEDSTFTFYMSPLTTGSCVENITGGYWSISNGMLKLKTFVGNVCMPDPTWNGKVKFRFAGDMLQMDLQEIFFLYSEMENEDIITRSMSREVFEISAQ